MSGWMYQLIRDEGKIKLCELYGMDGGVFYVPVSWFNIFKVPQMIIPDLLYQKKVLALVPEGEFINEMIGERLRWSGN